MVDVVGPGDLAMLTSVVDDHCIAHPGSDREEVGRIAVAVFTRGVTDREELAHILSRGKAPWSGSGRSAP